MSLYLTTKAPPRSKATYISLGLSEPKRKEREAEPKRKEREGLRPNTVIIDDIPSPHPNPQYPPNILRIINILYAMGERVAADFLCQDIDRHPGRYDRHTTPTSLDTLMIWQEMPQGHEYWGNLHEAFQEYVFNHEEE